MKQVNVRHKKKNTDLFFDSFKHFKHNLSNLIGVELPTLCALGAEKYASLISTNYKSKYPDIRKIGLIEYDKPSDNTFTLTEEAKTLLDYGNFYGNLNKNIYDENDLRIGRKNIDSLSLIELIGYFNYYFDNQDTNMQENAFNIYKQTLLKLLLSYYDIADSIRPYLTLLSFIRNVFIPYTQTNTPFILTPEILQNILAHSKEDILLMRYNSNAFNVLDGKLQEELRRPMSYIYIFLQTAIIIDSQYQLIVDYTLVDRLRANMDSIVLYQPAIAQNSRPAKEQRNFRENVLEAYNYRCAITGQSIWIDNRVLLETAHIIPYRDGGSFSVNNGIAYEMHKMFDNGLFGFYYDKDGQIKIKISQSQKIRDDSKILQGLNNKPIAMPQDTKQYPSDVALQYNLDTFLIPN